MMQSLGRLPWVLFILSGFVWGIIGIDGFNLVDYFFKHDWVVHAIYIIFGLAFVVELVKAIKAKKFRLK